MGGSIAHLAKNEKRLQELLKAPGSNLPMHKEGEQTVETPVEARAGFLDRPVLVVLTVSVILAVLLMVVVYVGVL